MGYVIIIIIDSEKEGVEWECRLSKENEGVMDHGTCVPRCQTSTRLLPRHVCAGVIESTASRV